VASTRCPRAGSGQVATADFAQQRSIIIVVAFAIKEIRMSGHPRTLAAAGAILSVLFLPIGHAQQQGSAIDRCASVADAAKRIRCLEDAIRDLSDPAAEAPAGAADAAAASDEDTAPTAASPAATTPAAGEAGGETPGANAAAPAAANDATPAVAAPARSGPGADASPLDRMGEEQVERENQAEDIAGMRMSAQVVQFDFVGRNKLRMRLENGQVWRQIDADRGDFYPMLRREERFEVELWQTGIGGYRMRFLPGNRTVRVRRIQ
jgi:hypothetical protein